MSRTHPERFIRDNAVAPFLPFSVVIAPQPEKNNALETNVHCTE